MSAKRQPLGDTAIVTAKVYLLTDCEVPIVELETGMSQDLPADNLGEIVCEAVQVAWRAGHDPVKFSVVVGFK